MVLTLLFFSSLPRARQKKIKIKAELSDCPWGKKKKKSETNCKGFLWRRKSVGIVTEITCGYRGYTEYTEDY